jgi:signal transduction histidine kinase
MIAIHRLRKISLSHRISLLFFFCIILPLAVMLGLFFYYFENELKNQSIQRLEHQAKNIRAAIYERLQTAENDMRVFLSHNSSPAQGKGMPFRSQAGPVQPKSLENLFSLDRQGAVLLLGGRAHSCDIQFSELSPIESEKPSIIKRHRSDGYPHLWMAIRTSNSEWLIGQINANYLWKAADNFNLPADTELCVIDDKNVALVASLSEPAHLINALSRLNGSKRNSSFSWGNGKQNYVASAHSLFLGGGFQADPWEIILSQSEESILSSIHQYRIYFLLVGFLMMLIVLLLSQVSIRRSLIPLKQLMARTKAIANEDFSSSIAIKGSPEFQELLDAFSVMSKKIEKKVAERTLELKSTNEDLSKEISQRIRAEENLKQAKESAELANRAKSEFLANMSHELRTPLNHIMGFTEMVVDKHFGGLNATQEEYLTDVLNSSSHLLSLINDILDLSKVEAGKLTLELTEIRLRDLLEGSLVMVQEKAMQHGIQISRDFDGVPEAIHADERKLKQILYNLLSNAVKFTPDGGTISFSAQYLSYRDGHWFCREDRPVVLPPDADNPLMRGGLINISLQDTGVGISPKDLERIFEPFEQAEKSPSRPFQGTGLGLSLTRKMVELHGGKIWAESGGKGKGSKFIFIIPDNRRNKSPED